MRKKWTKYTRRFHETLEYKKPMDVYQESIKLNQEKKRASWGVLYKKFLKVVRGFGIINYTQITV
jgi:hypothetical protein